MKTLLASIVVAVSLFAVGISSAQSQNMMNGAGGGFGWMGGYGGIGGTLLLVIVVAGFVAWFVKRGGK
jgi:hypothetical protein